MSYEHVWTLLALFALGSAAALAVWARHLRETKRLRVRELIHRERMAAFERGTAIDELPEDLAEGAGPDEAREVAGRWVERAALAAGLVLTLGGLGVAVGFLLVPDTPEMGGMRELAGLGLIPILVGIGLLLFAEIERRLGVGGAR